MEVDGTRAAWRKGGRNKKYSSFYHNLCRFSLLAFWTNRMDCVGVAEQFLRRKTFGFPRAESGAVSRRNVSVKDRLVYLKRHHRPPLTFHTPHTSRIAQRANTQIHDAPSLACCCSFDCCLSAKHQPRLAPEASRASAPATSSAALWSATSVAASVVRCPDSRPVSGGKSAAAQE